MTPHQLVKGTRRWKCQRRDVRIQRRDVPESHLSQRRDVPEHVEIGCRDVEKNVATLQRGPQNLVCQRRDVTKAWVFGFFQCRDVVIQRRNVTEGQIKKKNCYKTFEV